MRVILCFSLICLSIQLKSQYLYLSTDKNAIYRIENDYSLTYITTVIYSKTLTDIAISSTGKMYGIASQDLIEIDLITGEAQILDQLPGYDRSNSLTCSNDDKLFFRGEFSDVLYSYDLSNHSFRLINYLNSDQTYDVTFYRGNILIQSGYKYEIDVYDIQEQVFNKIACMPRVHIEGMSNLLDSCGSEHVYVIDDGSRFFEINFEEHQLVQVNNFWKPDRKFLGMASSSEHLASLCYSYQEPIQCVYIVDLHEIETNSFIHIFPNPTTDNITIESNSELEEVKIFNTSGILVRKIKGSARSIDVHNLDKGIYFLQIYLDQNSEIHKIIIQ